MRALVVPAGRYEPGFLAARREREALGELLSRPGPPPVGFERVPDTTLWLVDGDEFIGRISIRHRLSEALRVFGGHIGYDVRPSRRGQGHGGWMLRAALPHAAALGIDPAMLTCDVDNLASWRMIERAGGRRDATFTHDGVTRYRYWLPTTAVTAAV